MNEEMQKAKYLKAKQKQKPNGKNREPFQELKRYYIYEQKH